MSDENLSEDFKEILQNSDLSEKAKEAIQIISRGGTPSGKQFARPDLMKIIRFFMATYNCLKDEDKIESVDDITFNDGSNCGGDHDDNAKDDCDVGRVKPQCKLMQIYQVCTNCIVTRGQPRNSLHYIVAFFSSNRCDI